MMSVRYVDRSRIVTDWTCPRKRWWGYEYEGRGIAPATTNLELWIGTTVHDALAAVGKAHSDGKVDINHIATESANQMFEALSQTQPGEVPDADTIEFAKEQAALVYGLVYGFYKHAWPRLLQPGWRIVAVEQECVYTITPSTKRLITCTNCAGVGAYDTASDDDRVAGSGPCMEPCWACKGSGQQEDEVGGLKFMSRPDLVIADPEDNWWYVEFKTTSSKKQQWIDSWATAVQLHSGCKAVEETLGHPMTGVIVQGLYKGFESYGKQSSPFCYAYTRSGQAPFYNEAVRYDYAAGFRRAPTWERDGGVKGWVDGMPDNILADQFPQAPPIFLREELVEAFFRQVMVREEIITRCVTSDPNEADLDEFMPQHFDQCRPPFGSGCSFARLCHGRVENPLEQGYQWREPHHQPELESIKEAE